MRFIFIRHGEPDYVTNTLTENGVKEAEALKERVIKWDVKDFYVSPLGRAKATAEPSLKALGRTATEYDWLQEFYIPIMDPTTNTEHCTWDLMPRDFTADPLMMDKDHWFDSKIYRQYPEIKERALHVYEETDKFVAKYGYIRKGDFFEFKDPTGHVNPASAKDIMLHGTSSYVPRDEDDKETVVIFCHLGITCLMIARLIGISPVILWQYTCIAPTGVTILNTEKRIDNEVHFRIQALGDTSHLYKEGVKISGYGSFAYTFQG